MSVTCYACDYAARILHPRQRRPRREAGGMGGYLALAPAPAAARQDGADAPDDGGACPSGGGLDRPPRPSRGDVRHRGATVKHGLSRLGSFLRDNRVKLVELARLAGVSRQRLYRLRFGLAEPTRPVMIWLTLALRRILQREVLVTELFDFASGRP